MPVLAGMERVRGVSCHVQTTGEDTRRVLTANRSDQRFYACYARTSQSPSFSLTCEFIPPKLVEKDIIKALFSTKKFDMHNVYPTNLVHKLTGASLNQLKYWVRINLVSPEREGKSSFYSFKDIVKLRVLASLRNKGLSLQKVRDGIENLSKMLPDDEPLSRLIIYTDGVDMIVAEKGKYFSAITRQQYLRFDTEQIGSEIINLQKSEAWHPNKGGVSKKLQKM
jgi:DNA-binding transcriptional MerR regulator